jgi:hypothetical protein
MKKIMVTLFAAGFLLACNQGKENAGDPHLKQPVEKHDQHENMPEGLVLNNGAKWKADSSTRSNVALLQGIVSRPSNETLENYRQTAGELQDGLNKMVRECKMRGPDHDALHRWLEPLMEKTKELKNQSVAENAGASLRGIEKQLSLFPIYFE